MKHTVKERVERLEQGFLTFIKLGNMVSDRVDQLEKKIDEVESQKRPKEDPVGPNLEQPA